MKRSYNSDKPMQGMRNICSNQMASSLIDCLECWRCGLRTVEAIVTKIKRGRKEKIKNMLGSWEGKAVGGIGAGCTLLYLALHEKRCRGVFGKVAKGIYLCLFFQQLLLWILSYFIKCPSRMVMLIIKDETRFSIRSLSTDACHWELKILLLPWHKWHAYSMMMQ